MVSRLAGIGVVLCVVSSLVAQVGQAGGGFGGGGMGGSGFPITGDETTQSLILTPGDKGEWVIDAKEGETIVALATSRIFDPALEVVDEQNKVLASNDDIEPGIQNARLLYRFEKAGKYRVWVKGYKSAAGGQFDLTLRRFVPMDLQLGKKLQTVFDESGSQWFRIRGSKANPIAVRARAVGHSPALDMIGPTGNTDQRDFEGDDESFLYVMRGTEDKDYYIRVRASSAAKASMEITASLVPMFRMPIGSKSELRQLNPDDVEMATIDVESGDFIRVDADSTGPDVLVETGSLADARETDVIRRIYLSGRKGNWASHLAVKKGQVVLTVSQQQGLPTGYRISVTKPASAIGTSEIGKKLSIGSIDYYAFQGKKGDLVELAASSEQFDAHLRLITPSGVSLREDDDSLGRDPKISALLAEDGTYYLAVACSGMGGAGEYRVSRKVIEPMQLDTGPAKTQSLGTSGIHVWTVQGKAGQSCILNVNSKTARLAVTVYGPRGQVIARGNYSSITIVKFPDDGAYKVWVEATVGSGEYRIRLIDTD